MFSSPRDPLLLLPLSFSLSYPSFWSPKTSVHHHQVAVVFCLPAVHCLPSRESSFPAEPLPVCQTRVVCGGRSEQVFTWRTALMLFSRRAATQGAALQIRCLFICAEPDSLLSPPPPLPCLTLKTPSQPEGTFSKWKWSVCEHFPCSLCKHSARLDVPVPSEGWRYAFQLGIRRGRGLCRAPSEQSQSSHVNFSRSRRTSAMFRLWRWTEKYNNRNPAV